MDLIELLKRPEGKTLEFKRDLSSPDGVLRAIVAFANTAGGTILIGVEGTTRYVRGVRNPLDMEERLANMISDNIFRALSQSWKSCHGAVRMFWLLRYTQVRDAPITSRTLVLKAGFMCALVPPTGAPTGS